MLWGLGTWDPTWTAPQIECDIEGAGGVQGGGGVSRTRGWRLGCTETGRKESWREWQFLQLLRFPSGPLVWSSE